MSVVGIVPSAAATANASHASPQAYRPDIDGLRAIAVTAVVLFHAGLFPFGGGFVGVDVFFVISGYLIGGLTLRAAERGEFGFAEFYLRRARRILPALLLVVTATCVAGWFVLSASEYYRVGVTALTAVLGSSNLTFWAQQDYFAPDARHEPLLMTWSLGVEEQFYILFPFFVLAAVRFAPRRLVPIVLLATAASFCVSVWCTRVYPASAFYLLPARAWELGAGVTLAALDLRRPSRSRLRAEALAVAGLVALCISVFGFGDPTAFPGYRAALPVAGAAALIWSRRSFVNRVLLSARPMVFVGLISYSWYLWHWPIMSFVRIIAIGPVRTRVMVLCAGVAFCLAILSWRFVEQPFRRIRARPARALAAYGMVLAAFAAMTGTIAHGNGLGQRLPIQAASVEAIIKAGRSRECLAGWTQRTPAAPAICDLVRPGRPGIALIGDSHAVALSSGLRSLASSRDRGVSLFTKGACAPLLGVDIPHPGRPDFAAACAAFMKASFAEIAVRADIQTVIFAAYWDAYSHLGAEPYRQALDRTVAMMVAAHKRVIIMGDVPHWRIDPMHAAFAAAIPLRHILAQVLWMHDGAAFPETGMARLTGPADNRTDAMLRAVASEQGARYVDLSSRFCTESRCSFMRDGLLLFLDSNHLSVAGSELAFATGQPMPW